LCFQVGFDVPAEKWMFSRSIKQSLSDRRLILAAWIAVGIYLLGFAISAVIRWQNDFYIYRDAGLRAVLDQRIYDLHALNPFQYAPIYAVFFIPFGWLPVHWAQALWFLISMGAALPALILGSGRLLFGAASKLRADLIVVPLFLCTRFILQSFDKGQSDLLVLAMTAWGLVFANESKALRGGALLAASILIKPLAFAPLVYLIFRKRWSSIGSFICFTLLFLVVPIVIFGAARTLSETRDYLISLSGRMDTLRLLHDISTPNDQSATALAVRIFSRREGGLGFFDTGTAASLGSAFQFTLMLLVIRWAATLERTERRNDNPLGIAVVFATVPGLLPTAWMGYYAALMVPYMALVGLDLSRPNLRPACSQMALIAVAASFVLSVSSRFARTVLFYGAPYFGSLVILSAIIWIVTQTQKAEGALNKKDLWLPQNLVGANGDANGGPDGSRRR
jgi:Glycosyltransferase family 87